MAGKLVIRSEDDVIELLTSLDTRKEPISLDELKFDRWPVLDIKLTGPKFEQSLTPTVMKALLDYQRAIYQAYALAQYNTPSTRRLTDEERESLEIRVRVQDGSSEIEVDLTEILIQLGLKLVDKMEPTHLIATILGLSLIFGARSAWGKYLESRKETRLAEVQSEERVNFLESQKFLSEQESQRTQILGSVIKENTRLLTAQDIAHDAKTSIVKACGEADEATVQGIEVSGQAAAELTRNARRKSDEVRLDGEYTITRVDASQPDKFVVTVVGSDSGDQFSADVQEIDLTASTKKLLRTAEWDRKPVFLEINARVIDGDVRKATIVAASRPQ